MGLRLQRHRIGRGGQRIGPKMGGKPGRLGRGFTAKQAIQAMRQGSAFQHAGGKRGGGDNRKTRPRITQNMGVIARQVSHIGRYGSGTDCHDGGIGDGEFRPVFGNQQHAIPRCDTMRAQKRRQ